MEKTIGMVHVAWKASNALPGSQDSPTNTCSPTPLPRLGIGAKIGCVTRLELRLQKFFNGVPAEIFVNPSKSVERYFEAEQAARRPLTAHMLATGFVVLDLDPVIGDLQNKAERLLSQPPEAPQNLTYQRYSSASLFEDAEDIVGRDPDTAEMIVYRAVAEMLNFCFIKAGSFITRQKRMLEELAKIDPKIAELARSFYQASTLDQKMELAGRIADQTIGERGFFEWKMPPDEISE